MRPRVVLADDHALVLESVAAALTAQAIEVVGTASDGIEALRLLRASEPDVGVLDLHLPGRSGLEIITALATDPAPPPILLVTSFDDEATYRDALAAGARGFLGKGVRTEVVVEGIRALARGETYFMSGVSDRARARAPSLDPGERPTRDNPLSTREKEVLRLIATGLTTPEIAAHLGTRPGTVKNQTSSILSKLGVSDRTRAALVALREGWI